MSIFSAHIAFDYERSLGDWDSLPDETKAEIIKNAKKEARQEAKKDMVILLGVE